MKADFGLLCNDLVYPQSRCLVYVKVMLDEDENFIF